MSTSTTFTVELGWRCKKPRLHGVCDHINPGRLMVCESCGFEKTIDCFDDCTLDGKPISETFQLTDEEVAKARVTDAGVQQLFDRGSTWICTVCTPETDNRSTGDPAEDICSRCGSARLSTGMDRGKAEKVMASNDFDKARAHEGDFDVSDGPLPSDPFSGRVLGVFPPPSPWHNWSAPAADCGYKNLKPGDKPVCTCPPPLEREYHCSTCSTILSETEGRKVYKRRLCQVCGEPMTLCYANTDVPVREPEVPDLRPGSSFGRWLEQPLGLYGLIALGIIAAVFGLWWLLASHPVHVQVTAVHWSRSIRLEQRATLSGQGWGSPPLGAFNTSCSMRDTGRTTNCQPYDCNPHPKQFRIGSHKCNPHSVKRSSGQQACGSETYSCGTEEYGCTNNCTRSGKNGSASCTRSCSTRSKSCTRTKYCPTYTTATEYDDCPDYETRTVYDTCYHQCPVSESYCLYQYYEWHTADTRSLAGTDLAPRWPDLNAYGEEQRLVRSEDYVVIFSDSKEHWNHTTRDGLFQQFTPSSHWIIEVNRAGLVSNILPDREK